MLEKKSTFLQAVYSYLATFLLAVIFAKLFREFYIWQFNPPMFRSIFSVWSKNFELNFSGFIYAVIFFMPLIVFLFLTKKKWLIWLIGVLFPLLLIIPGGNKDLLWFVIFTIMGGLIGWLIKLAIKKFKKI